jgi:hypothetical protein
MTCCASAGLAQARAFERKMNTCCKRRRTLSNLDIEIVANGSAGSGAASGTGTAGASPNPYQVLLDTGEAFSHMPAELRWITSDRAYSEGREDEGEDEMNRKTDKALEICRAHPRFQEHCRWVRSRYHVGPDEWRFGSEKGDQFEDVKLFKTFLETIPLSF